MFIKEEMNVPKKGLEALINDIADTFEELQNSVRQSQKLERQSVLKETQHLIDERRLKLSLNREKYRNKRLKKEIAMSTENRATAYADSDDSVYDCRSAELRRLLQTRDSQLRKANRKIQRLVEENEELKRGMNECQEQINEMEQAANVVASYLSELQDQLQETFASGTRGEPSRQDIENELLKMRAHYEDQIVDLTIQLDNEIKINAQLDDERLYLASKLSKLENKRRS